MSCTWTLDAVPREVAHARGLVADFAQRRGFDEDALQRTRLAVSEAATNVVVHAYRDRGGPGELRVAVEVAGGTLQVTVSDDGMGATPRRTDSPGLGLGLSILDDVCDTVEVHSGEGTDLVMTIRVAAQPRTHAAP